MATHSNSIDLDIGLRIMRRRNELALSVSDVAIALSVGVTKIAGMESGYIRVVPDMLVRLSRLLQVDVDYFFRDHDSDAKHDDDTGSLEAFLSLAESHSLMRTFLKITSSVERQKIVEFAELLATSESPSKTGDGARIQPIAAISWKSP
jgi:transcriptional regulator with XRE-family HTH domain